MRVFHFKSNSPFFEKERDGVKNNTVREIDLSDDRFIELIHWYHVGWNDGDLKIQILYKDMSFTRDIRDISIWHGLMIITWSTWLEG